MDEYERQAVDIKKRIRKQKGISRSEFLFGFGKNSKLYPCVTLVLYYGEEWDGSRDLHGLLDFTDIPEELKSLVNNYELHLLEIRRIEDTSVFRTDLILSDAQRIKSDCGNWCRAMRHIERWRKTLTMWR